MPETEVRVEGGPAPSLRGLLLGSPMGGGPLKYYNQQQERKGVVIILAADDEDQQVFADVAVTVWPQARNRTLEDTRSN